MAAVIPRVLITPVAVSMLSPDCGGAILKRRVPVPPVPVSVPEVNAFPWVVAKLATPVIVIVSFTTNVMVVDRAIPSESVAVMLST